MSAILFSQTDKLLSDLALVTQKLKTIFQSEETFSTQYRWEAFKKWQTLDLATSKGGILYEYPQFFEKFSLPVAETEERFEVAQAILDSTDGALDVVVMAEQLNDVELMKAAMSKGIHTLII